MLKQSCQPTLITKAIMERKFNFFPQKSTFRRVAPRLTCLILNAKIIPFSFYFLFSIFYFLFSIFYFLFFYFSSFLETFLYFFRNFVLFHVRLKTAASMSRLNWRLLQLLQLLWLLWLLQRLSPTTFVHLILHKNWPTKNLS